MPELALYLPSLALGGVERGTVALANHWAALGRDVALLLDRAEGPLREALSPRLRVTALGVGRTARAPLPLLRYLRQVRPGLLHSAMPWNNLAALAAGRLAGVPVSVAEHSLRAARTGAKARLLRPLVRLAYPHARAVLAPSPAVAAELAAAAGLPRARIAVVGNPVVPANPPPHHPAPGPPHFLAIGRLVPVKDFPTLLRAFRLVLDQGPARLTLLGDGPERPLLAELARQLGLGDRFAMPGAVADPWPYLAAAAALVVSSRSEGFGNTVVEALACGTPVIATRCGGPEALLRQGQLGHLVPPDDPAAMAAAMRAPSPATAEQRRAAAQDFTVPRVASRVWTALGLPEPAVEE